MAETETQKPKSPGENGKKSDEKILHPLPEVLEKKITDEDAGIKQYLNPDRPGFHGIIKHRVSDFNVFEVDLAGNTVHLSSVDLPKEDIPASKEAKFVKYADLDPELKKLISSVKWTSITQMAKKYLDEEKHTEFEVISIDVTNFERDQRLRIHQVVKENFPHLTSNTEDKHSENGEVKKMLTLKYRNVDEKYGERNWPRDRPKYLHFTLYKEGQDSNEALNRLERALYMDRHKFQIAGTKDKRARTTQRVCHSFIAAKRLQKAVAHIRNMAVGNFEYRTDCLRLGDLSGNKFQIIIRDVTEKLEDIEPSLQSFKESGFINYFGLQRFGTTDVRTFDVGKALLKSEWLNAIELILKPRANQSKEFNDARAHWWQYRDSKKAAQLLGRRYSFSIEYNLFQGLTRAKDQDYHGALANIKYSVRQMYMHGYQSLIWNEMVSERIARFGTKVLVGDLVLADKENKKDEEDKVEEDKMDEDGKKDKEEPEDKKTKKKEEGKKKADIERAVHVTEETVDKYSIYDIVMPLPGYDVQYPDNELKAMYSERLAKDDFDLVCFKNKTETYSMPGGYRKILLKPTDVSWRMLRYNDPNRTLIQSDLDRLRKLPAIRGDEGSHQALVLEFTLPSSSYATMALREVMKADTSVHAQMALTVKHMENVEQAKEAKKRAIEEEGQEGPKEKVAKVDETNGTQ